MRPDPFTSPSVKPFLHRRHASLTRNVSASQAIWRTLASTLNPVSSMSESFSYSWLNYKAIDPDLTPRQVRQYEETETIWRSVVTEMRRRMIAQRGLLALLNGPTVQDYDALRQVLEKRSDLQISVRPHHEHDLNSFEGATSYVSSHRIPRITAFQPDPSDKSSINAAYQTLFHEFVHALHFTKSDIMPSYRKKAFDTCLGQFEDILERHCEMNLDWGTLFLKDKTIRHALNKSRLSTLSGLKKDLMSEAVAYELTASMCDHRNTFDKDMARGYRAAIRLINQAIKARQHSQPYGLPSPNKRAVDLIS